MTFDRRWCPSRRAKLFCEEKNPVEIIKQRKIYELLETATDRCEDVANIIERVVLENS